MIKLSAVCLAVAFFSLCDLAGRGYTGVDDVHNSNRDVMPSNTSDTSVDAQNRATKQAVHALKLSKAMLHAFRNFQPWNKCSVWSRIDLKKVHNWPESCDTGISTPILFKKIVDQGKAKYLLVVSTSPAWGESGYATSTVVSAFIFNYEDSGWILEKCNWYAGYCGEYGNFWGTVKMFHLAGSCSGFKIIEESWRMGVHTIYDSIYLVSSASVVKAAYLNVLTDTEDLCTVLDKENCREIFRSKYVFVSAEEELPRVVVTEKEAKYVDRGNKKVFRKTTGQKTYIFRDGGYGLLKTKQD